MATYQITLMLLCIFIATDMKSALGQMGENYDCRERSWDDAVRIVLSVESSIDGMRMIWIEFIVAIIEGIYAKSFQSWLSRFWKIDTTSVSMNCTNRVNDGNETDTDCGGDETLCPARCPMNSMCNTNSDCESKFCTPSADLRKKRHAHQVERSERQRRALGNMVCSSIRSLSLSCLIDQNQPIFVAFRMLCRCSLRS